MTMNSWPQFESSTHFYSIGSWQCFLNSGHLKEAISGNMVAGYLQPFKRQVHLFVIYIYSIIYVRWPFGCMINRGVTFLFHNQEDQTEGDCFSGIPIRTAWSLKPLILGMIKSWFVFTWEVRKTLLLAFCVAPTQHRPHRGWWKCRAHVLFQVGWRKQWHWMRFWQLARGKTPSSELSS